MPTFSEFITAAREMREAHGAHGDARLYGTPEFEEISKADKAAKKRFEELAADITLAEHIATLRPVLAFRSAADAIALATHRSNAPAVRSLLGDLPWPSTFPEAIARYGDGTLALEVWGLLIPMVEFAALWPAFLAQAMPVTAVQATTMDYSAPAVMATNSEPDCIACQ